MVSDRVLGVACVGCSARSRCGDIRVGAVEEGAERNKEFGIWCALGGIGATTAWLIGGPLVDGPGWEWTVHDDLPEILRGTVDEF